MSIAASPSSKPRASPSSAAPTVGKRHHRRRAGQDNNDAVLLTGGAEKPRDLPVEGRELDGIHFAMDFLSQQNRRLDHDSLVGERLIHANFKNVVVIGGGDTGSDCIGTSIRQGALSVTQLEIMPRPPEKENKMTSWPEWPIKLRISSSQQEGAESLYAVTTTRFTGENGKVKKLECAKVGPDFKPIPGTEFTLDADLVLWPWASFIRCMTACSTNSGSTATSAAMSRPIPRTTGPRATRSTPPATCAAASRSSSGPSAKAARPPAPSIST